MGQSPLCAPLRGSGRPLQAAGRCLLISSVSSSARSTIAISAETRRSPRTARHEDLSEVMKGRNAAVRSRATAYLATEGAFMISAVTVLEVVKGLYKARRHPSCTLREVALRASGASAGGTRGGARLVRS